MTKLLLEYSLSHGVADKAFLAFGILKALALAGVTWWLCGFSMWLWNRRFKLTLLHHVFCAFAALVTLVTIFTFQCLGTVNELALAAVKAWQRDYQEDGRFAWSSFVQVNESLQQLYRQNNWTWDSERYKDPPRQPPSNANDGGRYLVPLDKEESRELSLKIYVERAIEHLGLSQPLLSRILWKDAQMDMEPLRRDLKDFQANHPGGIYDFSSGSCRIAGDLSAEKLQGEVARQVFWLRIKLLAIFLLGQALAFGLAGYSAYSDLRLNH
jgi:hypothetical protein